VVLAVAGLERRADAARAGERPVLAQGDARLALPHAVRDQLAGAEIGAGHAHAHDVVVDLPVAVVIDAVALLRRRADRLLAGEPVGAGPRHSRAHVGRGAGAGGVHVAAHAGGAHARQVVGDAVAVVVDAVALLGALHDPAHAGAHPGAAGEGARHA